MKAKKIYILVVTLLIATALTAVGDVNKNIEKEYALQNINGVEWNLTIDRGEFDSIRHVEQTDDGEYICCGMTEETHMFYIHLTKVRIDGTVNWSVINYNLNGTVGVQESALYAMYVIQTSEGGYLVAGWSMKYFEYQGEEIWASVGYLWKTDSTGATEWIQQYYDTENIETDYLYCVKEIADGYVASGFQLTYDEEGQFIDEHGFLMETDAAGMMIWNQTYDLGEGTPDCICSVCPTNRGGYLLSGCTNSIDDDGSLWMLKTDEDGNEEWNEVFDGPNFEYSYARDCFETSDGGGIYCGNTNSYGAGQIDVWVIKTDTMGNIDWDKTIGDIRDDYTWDMCKTTDGGYVTVICKNHGYMGGTKDDIWLVKTTEDGLTEWTYLIEENDIQIPVAVRQTNDGGYIIAGRTRAVGSQFSDAIMYKVSAIENQQPDKPVIQSGPSSGHKFTEYTFTTSTTDPDGDDVLFMWDWGDGNYSEWIETVGASYEWSEIGEYEIRVMAKDINDGESEWSDIHTISITKNKAITINPIYQRLQKNHPNLFLIIYRLLQQCGL